MTVKIIQVHELDHGLITAWREIQAANANLRSPYYAPEYAQAVHASLKAKPTAEAGYSSTVEVAIIESKRTGKITGFFPFQRGPWGRILSVGRGLTDYQGIICADDFSEYQPAQLLSKIKGNYFSFNHLPLTAAVFSSGVKIHHQSPVMHTEGGFEAYIERLKISQNTSKPGIFTEIRKRSNRIVRELGPLRFEMHDHNRSILEKLMRLKIAQWKIGATNNAPTAFEIPWISHLMHSLFDMADAPVTKDAFRCALSTLYAGDTLLAIQLSLRYAQTLHCWFPAYDPELAGYSGGTVLMKPLTEQFAADGIELIDMGRGAAPYKLRVCTGIVPLGEGACSNPPVLAKSVMAGRLAVRAARRWRQKNERSA